MSTLTITQGFSGSGKSTWADKEILQSKGHTVGVNRDMLRMMTGRKWFPADEALVSDIAQEAIIRALGRGKYVIVDDTFLSLQHVKQMQELARMNGAEFHMKSFMHVSLHECIKRDIARDRSVGKDVIEQQYARYWSQQPKPANEGKLAIICDIDGTLAHTNIPYPAAYSRDYSTDHVDVNLREIIKTYCSNAARVIILTGRKAAHAEVTKKWLADNLINYDYFFSRMDGDDRDDATIKKELYMEHIQGKFKILFALDDRPRVVRMWRHELGLRCLHVTDNWEF